MSTWASEWGEDIGPFNWHPDNHTFIDVARDLAGSDSPIRLSLDTGPRDVRMFNTAYLTIEEAEELVRRLNNAIERAK